MVAKQEPTPTAPVLETTYSTEDVKKEEIEATAVSGSDAANVALAEDNLNATEEYTEAQFKRLLRKQDLILLPIMWVCYGTQQADKTSVSTQATFGMRKDLHMVGQQYSWVSRLHLPRSRPLCKRTSALTESLNTVDNDLLPRLL